MILTNVSRMGDFLLTFPAAYQLYKTTGEKIHYVLTDRFQPYKSLESLVLYQEFVSSVSYVDIGTDAFKDWKFSPSNYGIVGEYKNIGFPTYPTKYLPEYFGELLGCGFDPNFTLKTPDPLDRYKDRDVHVKPSPYRADAGIFHRYINPNSVELSINDSVLLNIQYALGAKSVTIPQGGFSVVMELVRKKTNILGFAHEFSNNWMYYRTDHNFIEYQ